MQTDCKSVPKTTSGHHCCLFPRGNGHIHPATNADLSNDQQESEQRQRVEAHVFSKLEEFSRETSTHLFHLTSFSRIRRRLKRDVKYLAKQFDPNLVSEEKIRQWIDETLERIDSHFPLLKSLIDSQKEFRQLILTDEIFLSSNLHNQWQQLQIKRAKDLFPGVTPTNEKELLRQYIEHIVDSLTPKQLENDRLPLEHKEQIDLNAEYTKAENIGKEYLNKLFTDYKQRQYPNLNLIKEIVDHGMKQMIKRPKSNELQKINQSSNLLFKALFILRSKNAYSMSLKNVSDDFMFLRFGRTLDDRNQKKDATTERFKTLIHMFLNTISILIHSFKSSNSTDDPASLFSVFDSNLPSEKLLSPIIYIDQWTWLIEKWRNALQTFPISLTENGAFGRLVRTTIGVGIARLYGFAENDERDDLDRKFFQALQMGFYYGIAYALVDGLQDTQSEQEQKHVDIDQWLSEMERVLCGHQLDRKSLPQLPITPLLLETFHSLVQLTSANSIAEETFTDLALLLRSQRSDKRAIQKSDENEIDLYIGPLMKSHFTYTATAFMGGARMVQDSQRLWTMPFLGQLTDDCRDFEEDRREKSTTPVTYYAEHEGRILNPFFVFLFVCEDLYLQSHREKNTGAFLGRRIIRTLRALQNHLNEFLTIFALKSYPDLYHYCLSLQTVFDRVSDPEKSIFRFVNQFAVHYSFNHRKVETFAYDHLALIEKHLNVETSNDHNPLIRGINHSLRAGGKRLRPLLLFMVAQICNIEIERILPLARAIEYLHTSSLILDDLPAQDNAPLRRGQPTLHMPIEDDREDVPPSLTEGRAQLVSVDLIAYAIELVNDGLIRAGFSYKTVNHVTVELSQSMKELCYGQFLDLQAARLKKSFTIDELDHIAHFKTGKAIEITFICPIILTEQEATSLNQTIERLRELARLIGILFQMKDDLLDVEGNTDELGKLVNIDQRNQTVTYISLLGIGATRKRIGQMRKQAEAILDELWPQAGTVRDVIRHICERKN